MRRCVPSLLIVLVAVQLHECFDIFQMLNPPRNGRNERTRQVNHANPQPPDQNDDSYENDAEVFSDSDAKMFDPMGRHSNREVKPEVMNQEPNPIQEREPADENEESHHEDDPGPDQNPQDGNAIREDRYNLRPDDLVDPPNEFGRNSDFEENDARQNPVEQSNVLDDIGHWGPWDNSICTKEDICKENRKIRERKCQYPKRGGPEAYCKNPETRIEMFNCKFAGECVVDGNWGPWSNPCTPDDIYGNRKVVRKRECNNPAPKNGGKPCPRPETSVQAFDCSRLQSQDFDQSNEQHMEFEP